jgi:hypothetical protein
MGWGFGIVVAVPGIDSDRCPRRRRRRWPRRGRFLAACESRRRCSPAEMVRKKIFPVPYTTCSRHASIITLLS